MRRRHTALLAAGLAALLAVTLLPACDAGGETDSPRAGPRDRSRGDPSDRPAISAPLWTLTGYTPVSGVKSVDGGFALYALDSDRRLVAIGVDAKTGEVRWSHPATPSWSVAGVGLHIATKDRLAVFMEPAGEYGDGMARVTAVDAVSGQPRWTYSLGLGITSQPGWCAEDRSAVCFISDPPRRGFTLHVLAPDHRNPSSTPLEDGRLLADGLFPAGDGTELVHVTTEGRKAWRRPIRELFGAAVNPDFGWSFRLAAGRYVGVLGVEPTEVPEGIAFDLGARVMAGFDAATGRPLWAKPGTFDCHGLDFDLAHPVRCRSSGRLVYPDDGEPRLEGDVTVEGFDPATGETRWSWDAGAVQGLAFDHGSVQRVDETTSAVDAPSGTVLLDLHSGQRRPARDVVGWCAHSARHTPAQVIEDKDEEENDLRVTQWTPCGPGGEAADRPHTAPDFAGVRSGNVFAWVSPDGLTAVNVE